MRIYIGLVIIAVIYACTQQSGSHIAAQVPQVPSVDSGKIMFEDNCGPCHAVNRQLIGPALIKFADTTGKLIKTYRPLDNVHKEIKITKEQLNAIDHYIPKGGYIN